MSSGLAYLGGFLTGGLVVFVVTARTIWKPMIDRLKAQLEMEKQHRLEREMIDRIPGVPTRDDWPDPIPQRRATLDVEGDGTIRAVSIMDYAAEMEQHRHDGPPILDLTGIDDVPYDD